MAYPRQVLFLFTSLGLSILFSWFSLIFFYFFKVFFCYAFFLDLPSILRICIPASKPGGTEAFSHPFVISTSKTFLEPKMSKSSRQKNPTHTPQVTKAIPWLSLVWGRRRCAFYGFSWVLFCLPSLKFLFSCSEVSTIINIFHYYFETITNLWKCWKHSIKNFFFEFI